jgi:hypothetical protein
MRFGGGDGGGGFVVKWFSGRTKTATSPPPHFTTAPRRNVSSVFYHRPDMWTSKCFDLCVYKLCVSCFK